MKGNKREAEREARELVPRLLEKIWEGRERALLRFPQLSRFFYRYGIHLLVLLFFFLYTAISLLKHMNFQSHGWDLGIFDQAIYQYSKFEIGYNTVRMVPCLLADHWHPSLFLFAPFYWVWSDVRMLLIVQALIASLGAVPIYLIGREKLGSRFAALSLAAVFLFFWGTIEMIFFDFHPHVLYPSIIAWMYYFIMKDRMTPYFFLLPLLLIIQEQVVLTATFIGVYLVVFRKKWFAGITTILISIGWFFAVYQVIIPGLATSGVYFYNKYYEYLGNNLVEAAKYLALHPLVALKLLFWPYHKVKLVLALLLPFLFLPLLGGFSIVVIPDLLQRLYSSHFPHWELLRHYNAAYASIFIIAVVEALPRFHDLLQRRYRASKIDFKKLVFAICILLMLVQFPFTFSRSFKNVLLPSFYHLDIREKTGYKALNTIPKDASVCAQDVIVPHLSHREKIYQFDGDTHDAQYVILNKYYDCYPFLGQKELAQAIESLYRDERYEVTDFGEGWLVFKLKPQYDID
jgi:uncharacterized membrane protein